MSIIDDLEIVPDDLQELVFLRPHSLKGNLKDFWAMDISGNWRIIFTFNYQSSTAYDLDFNDDH